jgi:hypothetical protein
MKAAKNRSRCDGAEPLNRPMDRGVLAQSAMSPRFIVVAGKLAKDPAQMGLPKHNQVVETFNASSVNRRGDHGSFSQTDTHISLLAHGPDFKSGLYDTLPTANVDVGPTVARILKFSMPGVQGRVLEEALQGGPRVTEYAVLNETHRSSTKTGLTMKLPTDLDSRSTDPSLTTYGRRTKDQGPHPRRQELHLLGLGISRNRGQRSVRILAPTQPVQL